MKLGWNSSLECLYRNTTIVGFIEYYGFSATVFQRSDLLQYI